MGFAREHYFVRRARKHWLVISSRSGVIGSFTSYAAAEAFRDECRAAS